MSSQIARTFLDENPQLQKLPSVRQGVFLNGAAAEMLLRALLTPDTIAALLTQGRVSVLGAGGKDAGGACPHSARPSTPARCRSWRAPISTGSASFVVGLDSPDGLYRVHMRLSGLTWLLSGVDVPEPIAARLAHLIAQRIGGAVEPPKDSSQVRRQTRGAQPKQILY